MGVRRQIIIFGSRFTFPGWRLISVEYAALPGHSASTEGPQANREHTGKN
jgi:hypothetical protein